MRKERGITLIALIITIIIMLILVAVSISILINSGLIGKAKEAGSKTKTAYEQESRMGDSITIDGVTYNSIDEYLADLNSSNPAGSGTLTITTNEIETESRAVILEVSAGNAPTEAEVLALDETEKKNMLVEAVSIIWNWPGATWDNIYYEEPVTTAEEAYTQLVAQGQIDSSEYTSFYDLLLKTGVCLQDTTYTCNGQTITSWKAEFVIAKNGSYTVTAANTEGTGTTNVNITKCKIEEFSSIQDTKQTLTIDGFTVTIPAGFAYGTSENVGHVTTGLVITDSVENVNGKNYSNGNEFVWIPVDENLKVGTASNNKVMARISSGTDYEGVLYDFTGTGNSTTSTEKSNYGVSTLNHREPAYLSNSYCGDASPYNTIGLTQNSLQTEYNSMIASIKANKGFYVGRYEMGIENGHGVSKLGITPASNYDGCTNNETGEGALRWYGLYSAAKNYTNSSNSVQSHMICGAEYDAMLNYALEGNDKGKINSTEYGNYGIKPLKTGTTQTSDKINNIYDLGGNMWEWTTEADDTFLRIGRGGLYVYSSPARSRENDGPGIYDYGLSSRVAIYIK